MDQIIVIRKAQLVPFILSEAHLPSTTPVIGTARPKDVEGKECFGIAPLHIMAHAEKWWALERPPGVDFYNDLTVAELKEAGVRLTPYQVIRLFDAA